MIVLNSRVLPNLALFRYVSSHGHFNVVCGAFLVEQLRMGMNFLISLIRVFVTTQYGLLHYDYLICQTGPVIFFQPI